MANSFENMTFEFFSAREGAEECVGTVIIRDPEMILEVDCGDERPYTIVGHRQGDAFVGAHQGQEGDESVHVEWTQLGGEWVGIWTQEGTRYLFAFMLPRD